MLTREKGKNDKMVAGLSALGIETIELPLIEHSHGPDRHLLVEALKTQTFQWVAVTSPESATVFLEGWEEAGRPEVRVAVVGTGTGDVLIAAGLNPKFTATKAIAKVMGAELPLDSSSEPTVLYPASAKASTDLQNSLTASGFKVTRLNTYNTTSVGSVDPQLLEKARAAEIVTFGSPTAVKAWIELVGLEAAQRYLSVCIGSTSARACDTAGLPPSRTYFPDAPGIDTWIESLLQACKEHGLEVAKTPAMTI